MPLEANYAELGEPISGYSEEGPFHCKDCIHRVQGSFCKHPAVMAAPALKSRKRTPQGYVRIDVERGCCRYVRPTQQNKTVFLEKYLKGEVK